MKLECFFNYLKEIAVFYCADKRTVFTIHLYEYSVKRFGSLKNKELILYMVAKANKDGFASHNNIRRNFFTKGQALEYIINTYFNGADIDITNLG